MIFRCYSWVGHIGGPQDISLGQYCHYTGIAAHEIGHALGFFHEHIRPDRDWNVQVLADKMIPGSQGVFNSIQIHSLKWVTHRNSVYLQVRFEIRK